jgi:hypothetical protein
VVAQVSETVADVDEDLEVLLGDIDNVLGGKTGQVHVAKYQLPAI